ncbi:MAG: HEPN domain-containing protein [Deltaproteobacteria bacterium]|nr:HEPN domain-containing protein [Deltaproteobacteria bacterium]
MTVRDLRQLVQYWLKGSDYDWETSRSLFRSKKYPYCLFLCHLSVEKLLKGLIVMGTKDHAPYTHNLSYLAGKLSLEFSKEQLALLEEMNDFNIEARYPDERNEFYQKSTKRLTQQYLKQAGDLREWLKKKY